MARPRQSSYIGIVSELACFAADSGLDVETLMDYIGNTWTPAHDVEAEQFASAIKAAFGDDEVIDEYVAENWISPAAA
jgi:hypothetical protein